MVKSIGLWMLQFGTAQWSGQHVARGLCGQPRIDLTLFFVWPFFRYLKRISIRSVYTIMSVGCGSNRGIFICCIDSRFSKSSFSFFL